MSHDAVSARTGEPMRCPTCGTRLVEVDRTGVLIDACPTCRGVWLDRGELDKILVKERQMSGGDADEDFFREVEGRRQPQRSQAPPPREHYHDERDYGQRKRRKRSFLEDLLDFE
jgi:Zn-finger nucleic acid-binding protein